MNSDFTFDNLSVLEVFRAFTQIEGIAIKAKDFSISIEENGKNHTLYQIEKGSVSIGYNEKNGLQTIRNYSVDATNIDQSARFFGEILAFAPRVGNQMGYQSYTNLELNRNEKLTVRL